MVCAFISAIPQRQQTIKVTLTKEGAQATCTLSYLYTRGPVNETWSGNHKAFKLSQGQQVSFVFLLEKVEEAVKHVSDKFGWTFHIEDLGGEAKQWTDEVLS